MKQSSSKNGVIDRAREILATKLEGAARQLKTQDKMLTRRTYQTESLFQMNHYIQQINSLEEMYHYLVDIPAEMLGANEAVFLINEGDRLSCKSLKGLSPSLQGTSIDFNEKHVKLLSKHNNIVELSKIKEKPLLEFIENIRETFHFNPDILLTRHVGQKCTCIIAIGSFSSLADMTDEDRKSLSVFMESAALGLQNLELIGSLREERDKLETAITSINEGIIYTDTELNILLINDSARDFLSPIATLRVGDNFLETFGEFNATMRLDEILVREDTLSFMLDHKEKGLLFSTSCNKLKDKEDQIVGMVLTLKDVQEEHYTEHLKTIFMSTISHKLRTPLTVIVEGTSLLKEGVLGTLNVDQNKIVSHTHVQAHYLKSLIGHLLDFTRAQDDIISSGMHKERHHLKPFFTYLISSMKNQFDAKKIKVSLHIEDEDMNSFFDKDMLQKAIGNILDNAVKFTPKNSKVEITATNDNNLVRIKISDNGPGIPELYRKHIFESFLQADEDFTGQIKGLGLGLYLTHEIIVAHGGQIACESTINEGTTFDISLPII